jgi:general secretion pathway protein M
MKLNNLKPSTSAALQKRVDSAQRRWSRLAPRERRLVSICGAVIGIALIYLVLIEPAWTIYRRLQVQLPLLRTQAATVDALTREARSLQRVSSGKMTPAETRVALADSLRQAGLVGTLEDIPPTPDTAAADGGIQVSVEQVSASTLLQWLQSAPAQTRLRLAQVELERPTDENNRLLVGKASGLLLFVPSTPSQAR